MSNAEALLLEESGRCINCGFCEAVCPTFPSSGYNASMGARGRVQLGKDMLSRLAKSESVSTLSGPFYSCLDCYACVQVCPAGVNAGKVSHLAREILVERSQGVPPLAALMEKSIMRYGSVLPLGRRASAWAEGLGIPRSGSTLLYTGQMYQLMSYSSALTGFLQRRGRIMQRLFVGGSLRMPWMMKLAVMLNDRELEKTMSGYLRNIASLLTRAGVEFGYMHEDEPYPGTLMFDLGFTSSARKHAQYVEEKFRRAGARRIITLDPHTHDLLANAYPALLGSFDFEVVHYTELLGGLGFRRSERKVTFHEPCHLSRRFDNMSTPLDLLSSTAEVRLPDNSGKRTHCCGGPDELLYPSISRNVSSSRNSQLAAAGGERTVTACPVCTLNLGYRGTTDLSQLLLESIDEAD